MKGFAVFFSLLLLALPSLAQATVDNCCQVNRTCATDAEWIHGWHDYQAGLCPVAAPVSASQLADMTQPPPTTDVDNCCQTGRVCSTDAHWIQGYEDYQTGQCDATSPVTMSSDSSGNYYRFTGTGRAATPAFTLTPGKWRFYPSLGSYEVTYLIQVISEGIANLQGTCLTFTSNWHWVGEAGAGLVLGAFVQEFAVRYPCAVQFVVFPARSASEVQSQDWTISIGKTDGNF